MVTSTTAITGAKLGAIVERIWEVEYEVISKCVDQVVRAGSEETSLWQRGQPVLVSVIK